MSHAPLPVPAPGPGAGGSLDLDRLAECVRRLDPGARALLDLSLRRRLPDDAMAPLLRTDAFHLAWRRARALERVADDLGGERSLGDVRAALVELPERVWAPLPLLEPPAPRPGLELVVRRSAALAPAATRAASLRRSLRLARAALRLLFRRR